MERLKPAEANKLEIRRNEKKKPNELNTQKIVF